MMALLVILKTWDFGNIASISSDIHIISSLTYFMVVTMSTVTNIMLFENGCYQVNHLAICDLVNVVFEFVLRMFCDFVGWLLAVQTFVTVSFILSFSSQILIALIVTRYPIKFILRYEWLLSGFVFIANAVCCKF
jgi:hypothetical protein